MANTGFKGVDVRQSGTTLLFRAFLQDAVGNLVTTGTTSLYLYELQDDGSIKSYDFNDKTLKTTALTTETASMTHRTGNNATRNTGLWTYAITSPGLTSGAVYVSIIENTNASPTKQAREFQYGEILATNDVVGNINGNVKAINDSTTSAARLALSAGQIVSGTVDNTGFSPTTTIFESDDITEATADHYKNRIVIFTTGALTGQVCSISAYALSTGRGRFTVSTLTEAPANNDTFIIV